MTLPIYVLTLLLSLLLPAACHASTPGFIEQDQDSSEGQSEDQQDQDTGAESADDESSANEETVVTDEHRVVWTRLAESAAGIAQLNEEQTLKLSEIYVESRAKFADVEDYVRDEWNQEMRRELEQQRAQGGVTGEIFDTTELDREIDILLSRERQRLAEKLVALLERDVAETVYTLLGGFDKRTDGATRDLMAFALEDEPELACIAALQQYHVEWVRARMLPVGEAAPAVRSAQETLVRALTQHLDREKLLKIARKAGVRFAE